MEEEEKEEEEDNGGLGGALPFSSDDSDGSSGFLSHGARDGWRRLKSRCQAGGGSWKQESVT